MINFNNMIKTFGCIALCSALLLTILALTMGFIDNKAVVDIMQLTMKGALIGTGIGTLGLIVLVLYDDCFYSRDGCCTSQSTIDNTSLLEPTTTIESTSILVTTVNPKEETIYDVQQKKRFFCC